MLLTRNSAPPILLTDNTAKSTICSIGALSAKMVLGGALLHVITLKGSVLTLRILPVRKPNVDYSNYLKLRHPQLHKY